MSHHFYMSWRADEAHREGHDDERFHRGSGFEHDRFSDREEDIAYFQGREDERREQERRDEERREEERAEERARERRRQEQAEEARREEERQQAEEEEYQRYLEAQAQECQPLPAEEDPGEGGQL